MAVVLVEPRPGAAPCCSGATRRLSLEETDVPPAVFTSGRILMLDATDLPRRCCAPRRSRARLASRPSSTSSAGRPGLVDLSRCRGHRHRASGVLHRVRGGGAVDLALEQFAAQFDVAVSVATLGRTGSLAKCGGSHDPDAGRPRGGRGHDRRRGCFSRGLRLRLAADGAWGGARSGAVLRQPRGRAELSGGRRTDGLAAGRRTWKTVCNLGVTRSV